jgi:hypothetical protein
VFFLLLYIYMGSVGQSSIESQSVCYSCPISSFFIAFLIGCLARMEVSVPWPFSHLARSTISYSTLTTAGSLHPSCKSFGVTEVPPQLEEDVRCVFSSPQAFFTIVLFAIQ